MARRVYFAGLNEVTRNLNKQIQGIMTRTRAGLWEAGLLVQRRAQLLAPVDTGKLKASAYANAFDTPMGPAVEIGFTAAYAPYVHEIVEYHHNVGQAKFLETALRNSEAEILDIIRQRGEID